MANRVADILRSAANILRTSGWVQRHAHYGGAHCAVGAIERAVHSGTVWDNDAYRAAVCSVAAVIQPNYYNYYGLSELSSTDPYYSAESAVIRYNDAPGRVANDVIAAMEAAAALCDQPAPEHTTATEQATEQELVTV